jgi:Mg2+-importing ATPase
MTATLISSLSYSVAMVVSLLPKMLPAIVNANLSKASKILGKDGIVVKNVNAGQVFGSIDTLCMDKTGTMTQNRISIKSIFDVEGNTELNVLKFSYLNSHYQDS